MWQKFKNWKNTRPFWGATLSLLSGLLILWIPLQLYAIAFAPGSMAFTGFLFGGLILILSVLLLILPQFNILCGILIIFLAVLSIMGALGGFFMGTIIGIIGGSLSLAWKSGAKSDVTAPSNTVISHDKSSPKSKTL